MMKEGFGDFMGGFFCFQWAIRGLWQKEKKEEQR
jgi:hypothetical protein